jgi:acetolactate synthase small subunit
MSRQTGNKKQPRSKVLPPVRVNESEQESIKAKAAAAGLSVSEYQRRALLDCVIVIRGNVVDINAVRQLSAIGNNLNQLTRKTHVHDEIDPARLNDILDNIDTIIMDIINGPKDQSSRP